MSGPGKTGSDAALQAAAALALADDAARDAAGHVGVTATPWAEWRSATSARIALGRAGSAMPTDETLRFGWAHAMARDAIHTPLDVEQLSAALQQAGWPAQQARSRAPDRASYLRRPDLGRQLDEDDAQRLRETAAARTPELAAPPLCIVIGDGLSSLAVQRHAVPLLQALREHLSHEALPVQPIPLVIVTQARVAVADEVGETLRAGMVAMLIGERPGLSSPDSLGIYLTHRPQRGCHDAQRNCISNVRPEGLSYAEAARKLAWLMREATRLGLTGVALKDGSDAALASSAPSAPPLQHE